MPLTLEQAEQLGRIEAKLDNSLAVIGKHEDRLTSLEKFKNRLIGITTAIVGGSGFFGWLLGSHGGHLGRHP